MTKNQEALSQRNFPKLCWRFSGTWTWYCTWSSEGSIQAYVHVTYPFPDHRFLLFVEASEQIFGIGDYLLKERVEEVSWINLQRNGKDFIKWWINYMTMFKKWKALWTRNKKIISFILNDEDSIRIANWIFIHQFLPGMLDLRLTNLKRFAWVIKDTIKFWFDG